MACRIQKRLLERMDDPKIGPQHLAQLSNAWERLEERKRILRMKPLPKAVDVPATNRKPAHQATFKE
jgi:hypothetical protein